MFARTQRRMYTQPHLVYLMQLLPGQGGQSQLLLPNSIEVNLTLLNLLWSLSIAECSANQGH